MMRTLLMLLLAALAQGQVELTVEVAREGRRLDPHTRGEWSGSGPYLYDRTRKLHFRAGDKLAESALSLTRHLADLRTTPIDFVVLHASAEVYTGDLPDVLERLQRQGWWTLDVRGDGAGAEEGRRWLANAGPAILGLEVEEVGTPIELTSGEAWAGIGRLAFRGRRLRITLDGGAVADLPQTLTGFHVLRPDAPMIVRFTPDVRVEEVADALAAVAGAGFERRALEEAAPWIGARGDLRILDIDYDGTYYHGDQVLILGEDADAVSEAPTLEAYLQRTAAGMAPNAIGLPSERFLLRIHPSAPIERVQTAMLHCGSQQVRLWRLDLAIAGLEGAFVPAPLPLDTGFGEEPPRLPVLVEVVEEGERVAPDRGPWARRGPYLYDGSRSLSYQFAVDELTDLAQVQAMLAKVAEIEGLCLVVDPSPSIVWSDVFSLVRAAHKLGIGIVFIGPD